MMGTATDKRSMPAGALRALIGRRLAIVSAVFVLVVSFFMAANWYLLQTVDPLDSPALNALQDQLEREPGNDELRQQIRELDLLARRAFFVRQWQNEAGAYLLATGAAALLIALQLMGGGLRRLPDPQRCPGTNAPWPAAERARRIVTAAGLLVLAVAATVSIFSLHAVRLAPDLPHIASAPERSPPGLPEDPPADAATGWPEETFQQWPAFRGVGGLGIAAAQADPPVAWDGKTGEGVRWKTPVPRGGFSSPVVWGTRVFLTGADEDAREVYCFDAETGALLWTADTEGVNGAPRTLPPVTDDTGYAAPSVATDGRRVIAIFGTGVILGLDMDGRRLWARAMPVPDNHYGHSSSLLVYGGMVYVQYDHFGGSEINALDIETGRTRWVQMREAEISWTSPILVERNGRMLLVLLASPMAMAYDALSGEERWENESMSGELGASPAYAAGRVFAVNPYANAVALDLDTGETLWSVSGMELPDAASPVATDDWLFLPTSYGVFTCVDAATGERLWVHEFDRGGYGSPILAGDRLYWVTQDGITRILRAADRFELLGEPGIGERSVSTPAVAGRRLYIRGENHLFSIGWQDGGSGGEISEP